MIHQIELKVSKYNTFTKNLHKSLRTQKMVHKNQNLVHNETVSQQAETLEVIVVRSDWAWEVRIDELREGACAGLVVC